MSIEEIGKSGPSQMYPGVEHIRIGVRAFSYLACSVRSRFRVVHMDEWVSELEGVERVEFIMM